MTTTVAPPTVPGYVNWFVTRLLRSPLHRVMSGNTMLLTVTGRKSGRRYVVVVRYVRVGAVVTCFTDSKWWINLRGGAPVEMLIGGRTVSGIATAVEDRALVVAGLSEFLHVTPGDSKYYGVRRDADGSPNLDDIRGAGEYATMIRIEDAAAR
ncbi:nitroreductase/quinone reductase family protein [Nocardia sp. NPDC049149]|uniref:nitroreductase/quinone reductase family protein n=1 Tax=Nocardia sp. NPDC049149 TaxID=3364315 RepID=UPI003720AC1C